MFHSYTPLSESSVLQYLATTGLQSRFFGEGEVLTVSDLADGNVNLIFRVKGSSGASVLVKQALPYARAYPDFKMPLERARIEHSLLTIYSERCEGLAPLVFSFDPVMFVNVMEDLSRHVIMRQGIMKQEVYQSFPEQIGRFLARSLFFTSDLFLSSEEKKTLVPQFVNPVLCKVTEDLVFTFPFLPHPTNRFPAGLKGAVERVYDDEPLQLSVRHLKRRFMTDTSALIHGDLHTGSVMVTRDETKVIDPEFGFFGPFGFDIGNVLGNLAIASFSQSYHAPSEIARTEYCNWLAQAFEDTWKTFVVEFHTACEEGILPEWRSRPFLDSYLTEVLADSLGFAGCEMFRRTIGMAHVAELDSIEDEAALSEVSRSIMSCARRFIVESRSLSVESAAALLRI